MPSTILNKLLTGSIALVWLINGLYCKLLNGVPRHEQIVARILGANCAAPLTKLIGFGEVLIAIWIVSRIRSRWCAVSQILLVGSMNVLECLLAPDLLLFGRLNMVNALLFIGIICYHEFVLRPEVVRCS